MLVVIARFNHYKHTSLRHSFYIVERIMHIYHCDRFAALLVTWDKFLVMHVNCVGLVCSKYVGKFQID